MKYYCVVFVILLLSFTLGSDIVVPDTQLRVIGGEFADPHSAPYLVALFARNRKGLIPFCAGSILNENWILTAGHCLILEAYRIYVVAGHHNINHFENTTQKRRADYTVQHEEFDQLGPYDIGLLHVSRPFQFTPQVQPVRLSNDDDPEGIVTVFGWGSTATSLERDFPSILRIVNLTLVSNEYCESRFPVEVDDGNICAGLPDGGKGACVGDSGGPIMQDGTQIGIISWGPLNCDPEEGPSVFTKITAYEDWIRDTLNKGLGGSEEDDDYYEDFVEHDPISMNNATNYNVTSLNTVQQ